MANLGLPVDVLSYRSSIYEPTAAWLADRRQDEARPLLIGVSGAQGSGKTTFCALLAPLLSEIHGLRTVVLSIDDAYHTRETRLRLAQTIHPLCATRGVPGTHDVAMVEGLIDSLFEGGPESHVLIPRFDKASDDRAAFDRWERVEGAVDVILLEGWCVGCVGLPEWSGPTNQREQFEDPEGVWMRWSRDRLYADYLPLFERLDGLIMLKVSSMHAVREGRWLQEQRLWEARGAVVADTAYSPGLMTRSEVDDYVALFERYTRHMLATLPERADVLIARGEGFSYAMERLPSAGWVTEGS